MPDSGSNNRGPRACITCAKAKSRCVPGPSASKCERCHRLNKPCGSQTPAPPRAKKVQKTTRVSELEKRLDQLASQLHSSNAASASGPTPNCTGGRSRFSVDHIFHLFPSDTQAATGPVTPGTSGSSEQESPVPRPTLTSIWPTPAEAEAMLERYKSTKASLFPFVVIPPGMSEVELRTKRPFLWKGIMVAERFFDGTGQIEAGKALLTEISRATFIEPLKSLDVLHGLQLAVAWVHYCLNGFQLTNTLFLCRSLCVALRLTKDAAGPHDSTALERMRAFAGCYFLNTIIFTAEKLPDALMNTSYLDTCCSVLEANMEYESDLALVQMVKIQKLAQSIAVTWDGSSPSLPSTHLPPTMIVQAFQQQIDSFRANLPPHLQENYTIKSRIAVAEILLYEIALKESPAMAQPDRLSLLWRCLQSVNTYMHLRFDNNDIHHRKFICLMAADFVFAAQTGLRLLLLRTPGWNLPRVWETLAVEKWLGCQMIELEQILEERSRASWTKELQVNGLAPVVVDPFQKLLLSLKGFSALIARENEKNVPVTPPEEEEQVVPTQDEGFLAEMDAEMSLFDDLHLTQFDFLTMDASTPQWEY